ncbi:uncharacterized protein LOC132547015 [Ylistrum balloti]|uniref:uncharacterized protein LOC132547015 n=1 Tax=Ylistrum balloti TaxID=509963 RepID=UPI002905E680|nr:uncharacterized protein LOC132547015 [Ylistrum balloti]
MGFSESSVLLKIALVVLPLALILHIVGLATPHWSSHSVTEQGITIGAVVGLWKGCLSENGASQCTSYDDVPGWLNGCRAFGIIGVLAVAAAAILEALCTIALSKDTHKIAFILSTITAFVGAGSIILCAIIWAAKASDLSSTGDLAWSFGLSIAGGVLAGLGGLLVSINLCQ